MSAIVRRRQKRYGDQSGVSSTYLAFVEGVRRIVGESC
jgi:hypothetical protein